jgi:hypothetical protein
MFDVSTACDLVADDFENMFGLIWIAQRMLKVIFASHGLERRAQNLHFVLEHDWVLFRRGGTVHRAHLVVVRAEHLEVLWMGLWVWEKMRLYHLVGIVISRRERKYWGHLDKGRVHHEMLLRRSWCHRARIPNRWGCVLAWCRRGWARRQ